MKTYGQNPNIMCSAAGWVYPIFNTQWIDLGILLHMPTEIPGQCSIVLKEQTDC